MISEAGFELISKRVFFGMPMEIPRPPRVASAQRERQRPERLTRHTTRRQTATSGELAGRPYLRAHGGPWAAREGGSGTKRIAPDTHELGVAGYGAGVGCGGRS